MRLTRKITTAGIGILIAASGVAAPLLGGGTASAHAARPGANTVAVATAHKTVIKTYKINGTYSGTISIVWNQSGPSTATISGKGKGTIFNLTSISGSGKGTAAAQSDPINGSGILAGKGESLSLKLATGATATAVGSAAPTLVTVSGNATITKGAGLFAGATGTLKVSGDFSIKSTSGKEKDSFTTTLKGTVTVKTTSK